MKDNFISVKFWAMLCWYASMVMLIVNTILLLIPAYMSLYIFIATSFFLLLLMGFFYISSIDTKDKSTKYISIISGIGTLGILLSKILDIVWMKCERPEHWYSYEEGQYPVYDFCVNNYMVFNNIAIIGGIFMALYFYYVLRRSNYTLNAICIPAIISCLLLGASSLVSIARLISIFISIFIYLLFVFVFYKLYKIL